MTKKKATTKDREEQANRRLTKAQEALQHAQAKRTLAMSKGEREVEAARARAGARLARATQRVERHAVAVARANAQLLKVRPPSVVSSVVSTPHSSADLPRAQAIEAAPGTPDGGSEGLEHIEAHRLPHDLGLDSGSNGAGDAPQSGIVRPDGGQSSSQ